MFPKKDLLTLAQRSHGNCHLRRLSLSQNKIKQVGHTASPRAVQPLCRAPLFIRAPLNVLVTINELLLLLLLESLPRWLNPSCVIKQVGYTACAALMAAPTIEDLNLAHNQVSYVAVTCQLRVGDA
jgi:hypothetical protein